MIDVTVIYPKGSLRSGNDSLVCVSPFRTESRLMPCHIFINEEDDHAQVLERIYRMFNRVDGSDIEHYVDYYQERSLSFGDIVRIGNRYFRCDFVGWSETTDIPDDIKL